ncbi:hypothetical protein LguiA_007500 [Lonicera macranthoides]
MGRIQTVQWRQGEDLPTHIIKSLSHSSTFFKDEKLNADPAALAHTHSSPAIFILSINKKRSLAWYQHHKRRPSSTHTHSSSAIFVVSINKQNALFIYLYKCMHRNNKGKEKGHWHQAFQKRKRRRFASKNKCSSINGEEYGCVSRQCILEFGIPSKKKTWVIHIIKDSPLARASKKLGTSNNPSPPALIPLVVADVVAEQTGKHSSPPLDVLKAKQEALPK